MTSKLQVTIPKAIADQYRIQPGDEIEWLPAGEAIRVTPARSAPRDSDPALRLELFDQATRRQRRREVTRPRAVTPKKRGWTREELYTRGRAR